ncbi:glycosyltransferase [Winogradskyella psychrotolerans]|uniref:glycosyltransferase n=1 Tax=Winogradskyella psychrotolerans TaxID=1344585 RepID=UPI001C064CAC|nr:glycosyltransferase [Winogradskyella psychrotolerans]MBU2926786.1 glycosyltransferase [Winogradskyella psychrotolerans]
MNQSRLILVMAHYNNPKGLEESLASINEQIDIDILVVDDGSDYKPNEDALCQIYNSGKIYFEYLKENKGVGVAANLGLDVALKKNYEFIGRFDCGDIFMKDKCFKQINYLDQNKEVKLLGTWANVIDEHGTFLHELKHPTDYETLKKKMYLNSMFLNPSVIFYSEILEKVGNYPFEYRRASQDYAFFFKALKHYKVENYPEILMYYVSDPNSISTQKRRLQVLNRIRIILDNFYFGFYPIYGLFRNIPLLFVSRKLTTKLKKKFKLN